jgi:crotonobetainyl-CoA:carnitine CoA-transferase CaiB-like acyl-CoA transferase
MPMALPGRDITVHVPTLGFKVNGDVVAPNAPPPELGRDTESILEELGCSAEDVAALQNAGAI